MPARPTRRQHFIWTGEAEKVNAKAFHRKSTADTGQRCKRSANTVYDVMVGFTVNENSYLRFSIGSWDRNVFIIPTTPHTLTLCTMPRDRFGTSNIGTFACQRRLICHPGLTPNQSRCKCLVLLNDKFVASRQLGKKKNFLTRSYWTSNNFQSKWLQPASPQQLILTSINLWGEIKSFPWLYGKNFL